MTDPWWRPKRGDLIATIDTATGEPCDEVIEVLESGEAEEIGVGTGRTAWMWTVKVLHREGYWAGREMSLALRPGEYVRVER